MGVIGKHVSAIDNPETVPPALKLIYISFVIVIIGCVLSKTSFAITLLRIVTRTWMKVLLWIIIVSMNAIMWLCAVCYLAQCKPVAALWNTKLMATAKCWPTAVFETIALTAGGKSTRCVTILGKKTDVELCSILWVHGLYPCPPPMGGPMETSNEETREARYSHCHEHGCFVSTNL